MPLLSAGLSASRTGSKAASVFPEPVGATTRTSEPSRIREIAATCIELSLTIPALPSKLEGIDPV